MTKKLILLITLAAFIWTGCATQKTLESGDEFSVDAEKPTSTNSSSDDLSLEEPPPAKNNSTTDKANADVTDIDAALENELNSLDNKNQSQASAVNAPPEKVAAPQDELSLDSPASQPKDELSLDDSTPQVVAQNNTPTAPETAPLPPEVILDTPPDPVVNVDPIPTEAAPVVQENTAPVTINTVQYKGNINGGTIAIGANMPLQFTTRFNSTTNQFIVEVQNSIVPQKLTRTLNTKDMSSSIGSVDIYQKTGSNIARFVVQLRPGSAEPIVQPEGNSILIIGASNDVAANRPSTQETQALTEPTAMSIEKQDSNSLSLGGADQPAMSEKTATDAPSRRTKGGVLDYESLEDFLMGEQQFSGKKISLDTSGLGVAEAINFLADESGANIIMDDSVSTAGKINIKLRDVPWDQAFVMILKSKKLVYKRQGNVIRVGTLVDFKADELEAITLKESRLTQQPVVVKRFFIAYADINELKTQVEAYLNSLPLPKGAAPVQQGSTASANKVIIDKRNNSLIVTDIESSIKNIEQIVKAIDTQPKQVLIESKIVAASESFSRGLGISWTNTRAGSGTNGIISFTPQSPTVPLLTADVSWGQLDFLGTLTSTLKFAETQSVAKILASPSITVLSNVSANIKNDVQLKVSLRKPVPATATTPAGTGIEDSFVNTGLNLKVTPIVTNENTVYMKLDLTRSIPNSDASGLDVSSANTEMFVKSGFTAVIGGLFQSSDIDITNGLPFLKDVPVIGNLFKGTQTNRTKSELMMFITPTVLKPL